MTLEAWDIDRFPVTSLNKEAISDAGFPESDSEWKTWEEAQRALNDHAGGGGYDGGRSEYDPSVWMMGKHAPSHEKYRSDDDSGHDDSGSGSNNAYYMPGITHSLDDDDDDIEREPSNYHVVTRPIGSTNPDEWTEHPYTMWEHPDTDYNTGGAWDYFMQDNPQYNDENPSATHEIAHVHPAEGHDAWRNGLRSEDDAFSKIAPHGFERESDVLGHKAYTHTDPQGGIHRLWHNQTTFTNTDDGTTHGPGWRTSYWSPSAAHHEQLPWSFHDDDTPGDPLDEALKRVERNKIHSQVAHSGTGLRTVENSYGRHYVSKRPDGSIHQMLRNFDDSNGNDNWNVVHYPADNSQHGENYPSYMAPRHTYTEHGADLAGALAQAKSNLTRG